MNLGAAATSSKNALQWEIPLPQIMFATKPMCFLSVLFAYQGHRNLTFPFQLKNMLARAQKGRYQYDLRQNDTSTPCPYDFFDPYLNSDLVRKAIGAEVPFVLSSDPVEAMFNTTGDVISSCCLHL